MKLRRVASSIVSATDGGIWVLNTFAMSSQQHAEGACICSTSRPKPYSTASPENSLRGSSWSI
eukprot:12927566-Prorocentrum_lima.AAC.1